MAVETRRQFDVERGRQEVSAVRQDVASIADDLRVLALKEAELARAEFAQQLGFSRDTAISAGVAAIAALLMLTFAGLTLMFALSEGMPTWVAGLITTVVFAAMVAFAAAFMRARMRQISLVPRRTIDSIREDVKWARSQLNLNAR
jgi:hypothetical protein